MENQQNILEEGKAYMDLTGLSEYSSIGKSTLRQHIKNGDLPAYRIGGKIIVKRETFDSWVDHHAYEPEDLNLVVDSVMGELSA